MGLLAFQHPLPNTAAHILTGIVAGAPHLPPWVRGVTALLFAAYQLHDDEDELPWSEMAEFVAGYALPQNLAT